MFIIIFKVAEVMNKVRLYGTTSLDHCHPLYSWCTFGSQDTGVM